MSRGEKEDAHEFFQGEVKMMNAELNAMTIKELNDLYAAKQVELEAKHDEVKPLDEEFANKFKALVKGFLRQELGDSEYEIVGRNGEGARVRVWCEDAKGEGEYRRATDVDIYVRSDKVEMNFCTFGSFDATDKYAIAYVKAVACVAKGLEFLTDFVKDNDLLKRISNLRLDAHRIHWGCTNIKAAIQKKEREVKKAEVRAKLVPGVKVNTKPNRSYGNYTYTIDKVMPKNIEFVETYGRTKIDEAVANLVEGVWAFAA